MPDGLRDRKKAATREALSAAALRLALEQGADSVRVDDIAAAAGVSPRTYNNYFASREQAIVAAVTAERALRVAAALRARPSEPLAQAVIEAVVEQYTSEPDGDVLTLITTSSRLSTEFVDAASALHEPLAAAIADRVEDTFAASVLAAMVTAAARTAVHAWVSGNAKADNGFVVVSADRPLAGLLRQALAYVAPALNAYATEVSAASRAAVGGGSGGSP